MLLFESWNSKYSSVTQRLLVVDVEDVFTEVDDDVVVELLVVGVGGGLMVVVVEVDVVE